MNDHSGLIADADALLAGMDDQNWTSSGALELVDGLRRALLESTAAVREAENLYRSIKVQLGQEPGDGKLPHDAIDALTARAAAAETRATSLDLELAKERQIVWRNLLVQIAHTLGMTSIADVPDAVLKLVGRLRALERPGLPYVEVEAQLRGLLPDEENGAPITLGWFIIEWRVASGRTHISVVQTAEFGGHLGIWVGGREDHCMKYRDTIVRHTPLLDASKLTAENDRLRDQIGELEDQVFTLRDKVAELTAPPNSLTVATCMAALDGKTLSGAGVVTALLAGAPADITMEARAQAEEHDVLRAVITEQEKVLRKVLDLLIKVQNLGYQWPNGVLWVVNYCHELISGHLSSRSVTPKPQGTNVACACHLEEGDSPCPVHGEDEESRGS